MTSTSTSKICVSCKRDLPIDTFGNCKDNPDGKRSYCLECDRKKDKEYYERKKSASKVYVDSKTCPDCKTTKNRDQFNKQTANKDGLSTYCKDCSTKRNKDARKKAMPHEVTLTRKVCPKCGNDKTADEFYKDTSRNGGLSRLCRECEKSGAAERCMKIKNGPKVMVSEKKCVRCQLMLPSSNFTKDNYASDGLNCYCRGCMSVVNKENRPRLFRKEPQVDRKFCPSCKMDKDIEGFYYAPLRSDGLSWECKECNRTHVKKWAEDHPDRKKENDTYSILLKRIDGREKQHDIEFRETHPDYRKEYREENREHIRTYARYYGRERRAMNRTQILEYMKQWRIDNPDKARLQDHKRISRHHALPFEVSEEDIGDIFEMFGECCAFCGSEEDLELDHVIPVSWDDPANPGTVRGNLMSLCGACNVSKTNKSLEEYLADDMLWMVRFQKSLQERGISEKDLETEIKFLLHMSSL